MANWNINKVLLTIGTHTITAPADEETGVLAYAWDDPNRIITKVDAYGNSVMYANNNNNGVLTIRLAPHSISNEFLSTLNNVVLNTGTGTLPVRLIDKNNDGTLITSQASAVKETPNPDFGTTGGTVREWKLQLTKVSFFLGGYDSI